MFERDLQQLQEAQAAELAAMRRHYRQLQKALSPTRLIKEHPIAAISAAAMAGVVFAPHAGKKESAPAAASAEKPSLLMRMAKPLLNKLRQHAAQTAAAPSARPNLMTDALLAWQMIERMRASFAGGASGDGGHGESHLAVVIGDGGTIHASSLVHALRPNMPAAA